MATLPNVEVKRVRKVELAMADYSIHIDDQLQPDPNQLSTPLVDQLTPSPLATVTIEVLPQALEVWLPAPGNNPSAD